MVALDDGKKLSHDRAPACSFPDIVGQSELKRALLAVAANDGLDGLLIQGEKGTAKSTAVRGLVELLPTQTVVEDCPYGCPPDDPGRQCESCRERTNPDTRERPVPLVTLPLGATRERVVGTLSVADALAGEHEFDPGLLARANRGILYVDEVNLLDDHLVDVLLDAAASGVNRVERDGVSVAHPSEFTVIGTMNPEEGDLRPQLRDRFALQATVTGCTDLDQRVEIIDQALDADPDESGSSPDREDDPDVDELREQLTGARDCLDGVELSPEFKTEIASLCRDAGLDGHRGDIATARAARTFAALEGRPTVIESDVREAAELAIPHRLQSRPFEDAPEPDAVIDDHFDDESAESADENEATGDGETQGEDVSNQRRDAEGESNNGGGEPNEGHSSEGMPQGDGEGRSERNDDASSRDGRGDGGAGESQRLPTESSAAGDGTMGEDSEPDSNAGEGGEDMQSEAETAAPGESVDRPPIVPGQSRAEIGESAAPSLRESAVSETGEGADGRRGKGRPTTRSEGVRVRTEPTDSMGSVDAAATIRAAGVRGAAGVESRDLRRSVRQQQTGALVVFAVDASASMVPAMRAAKGTVLELLQDAYQHRDEVAFVAFAGDEAEVLLPPTDSVTLAARHLKELPTGDRTPLPDGLRTAGEVLERADPAAGVVVLVTDGRANVADDSPVAETRAAARAVAATGAHLIAVDASDGDGHDLVETIVQVANGERVPLSALSAERVDGAVDAARQNQL